MVQHLLLFKSHVTAIHQIVVLFVVVLDVSGQVLEDGRDRLQFGITHGVERRLQLRELLY